MLKDHSILMPENIDKLATTSVLHLSNRFSAAVSEEEIDKLEEEIMDSILTLSYVTSCVQKRRKINAEN